MCKGYSDKFGSCKNLCVGSVRVKSPHAALVTDPRVHNAVGADGHLTNTLRLKTAEAKAPTFKISPRPLEMCRRGML